MLIRPHLSPADNRRIQAMLLGNQNGDLRQQLLDGAPFLAELTHTAVPQRAATGTTATFTRATTATVQNNDGYLVTALAGEARFVGARRVRNQFTFTQAFDNAAWAKFRSSISADATTAPDGTLTADKLVEDGTAGATHFMQYNTVGTVGSAEVLSISAKPAGRDWLYLQLGNSHFAYFNVSTGTVGTVQGSGTVTAITLDAEGFYRCSLKAVRAGSQINYVMPASADNTASYNGDGVSGLYIWGAQLEDVTAQTTQTAGEYVSVGVESAPYYHGSFVDGVKCFNTDIAGNAIPSTTLLGYLAEGARTNLCTYSNGFDNAAWSKLNSGTGAAPVVTPNYAVAPDGTTTAYRLQLNRGAGAGSGNYSILRSTAASGLANPHTSDESLWVKTTSGGTATILFGSSYAAGFSVTVTSEWTRLDKSQSVPQTIDSIDIYLRNGVSLTNDQSADILIWGAQLELGSFASSYIATTTAAVTRNADVLTYSSAGNIDGTKGWCYAEFDVSNDSDGNQNIILGSDVAGVFPLYAQPSLGNVRTLDGTNAPIAQSAPMTGVRKGAGTWGGSTMQSAHNGVVSSTTAFDGNMEVTAVIRIGEDNAGNSHFFGTIKNLYIGQRQLSASEMQAVTS